MIKKLPDRGRVCCAGSHRTLAHILQSWWSCSPWPEMHILQKYFAYSAYSCIVLDILHFGLHSLHISLSHSPTDAAEQDSSFCCWTNLHWYFNWINLIAIFAQKLFDKLAQSCWKDSRLKSWHCFCEKLFVVGPRQVCNQWRCHPSSPHPASALPTYLPACRRAYITFGVTVTTPSISMLNSLLNIFKLPA